MIWSDINETYKELFPKVANSRQLVETPTGEKEIEEEEIIDNPIEEQEQIEESIEEDSIDNGQHCSVNQ